MQGLTSGQDEWWSLLAIDFSSAYTEQLLCTAGAEIEFADWGWVALWAALRDWTVGWRERRGWTSALHSICRYTVQSRVHVVSCTGLYTPRYCVLIRPATPLLRGRCATWRELPSSRRETRRDAYCTQCGCVTRDRPAQRYAGAACGAHALDRGTVAQRFESMNLHALASLH